MNVLIIDDAEMIPTLISRTLSSYGYTTHHIRSSATIKGYLRTVPLSIVIINSSLKHADGANLCTYIRNEFPHTYIIGIHTSGQWQAKVDLLLKGADDCLSFPFPAQELLARIQAILRRPKQTISTDISFGDITIHPAQRKSYCDNTELDLTRREYQVLEYLVRNKDRTVTRAELLDNVWDYTRLIGSNTVDVHIQKLRRKIDTAQNEVCSPKNRGTSSSLSENEGMCYPNARLPNLRKTAIETVHGVGYRLSRIDAHSPNQSALAL